MTPIQRIAPLSTVAGTASSVAAALDGAETCAAVGMITGPPGALLGELVCAMMCALIDGAADCADGAAVGDHIDAIVLDNYEINECGLIFRNAK